MFRKLAPALLLLLAVFLCLQGRASYAGDTLVLPAAFRTELNTFKQKDDLASWIYARIDYAEAAPASRIRFLMATQKEAWRLHRNIPEREAWFNLLILQGYHLLQTGNMLGSIRAYEKAVEFYDTWPVADPDEYITYVLKPLGNNYTRLADYDAALYIQQKTLQLLKKEDDPLELAGAYANLATSARWKGDLDAAARYGREGLGRAPKHSALYGLLLNTYADIQLQQARPDSALLFSELALHQLGDWQRLEKQEPQALYWLTAALQLNASVLLQQHQFAMALRSAGEAFRLLQKFHPQTRQREKAKIKVLAGNIHLAAANPAKALEAFQQSLQLLLPSWKADSAEVIPPADLLYSENTLTDALAGKAAALAALGQNEIALDHYLAMFAAARKLRAAFAYTNSKIRDLQLLRRRSESAMELAWQLQETTANPERYKTKLLLISELSKAQVLQDERAIRWQIRGNKGASDSLQQYQQRLQEAVIYYQHQVLEAEGNEKARYRELLQDAEFELTLLDKRVVGAGGKMTEMLSAESLKQLYVLLPPATSVVSFFEGKKHSYLVRFNRTGITDLLRLSGNDSLGRRITVFVNQWFGKGATPMMNEPGKYCEESYALWKQLFGKWKWEDVRRCILLPDGSFSYIPFDALVTASCSGNTAGSWPYFFKNHILSQAWSFQTWCDQQSAHYSNGEFSGWFVAKSSNTALPVLAVEKEQEWLQDQFPGRYFLNEKATWQAFRQQLDSVSVLHIGAHAISEPGGPFPYLQLYDQPFYLFDLRYSHFAPSLVWLGACRTGNGNLMEGEGVNSLSRAFAAAGAGGVVAGMWNMNDNASSEIMQLFYKNLSEGVNAATALQNAKDEYLYNHRNNPMLQLPYYWAGFTYSGHLQPVYMQPKVSFFAWILASLSILTMLVFFWWFFKRIYK